MLFTFGQRSQNCGLLEAEYSPDRVLRSQDCGSRTLLRNRIQLTKLSGVYDPKTVDHDLLLNGMGYSGVLLPCAIWFSKKQTNSSTALFARSSKKQQLNTHTHTHKKNRDPKTVDLELWRKDIGT